MRVPQIAVPGPRRSRGRLARGEGQDGVAVREQHLAVGDPHGVEAEGLGVGEEADLVDVGHDADAEAHRVSFPSGRNAVCSRNEGRLGLEEQVVAPRPGSARVSSQPPGPARDGSSMSSAVASSTQFSGCSPPIEAELGPPCRRQAGCPDSRSAGARLPRPLGLFVRRHGVAPEDGEVWLGSGVDVESPRVLVGDVGAPSQTHHPALGEVVHEGDVAGADGRRIRGSRRGCSCRRAPHALEPGRDVDAVAVDPTRRG